MVLGAIWALVLLASLPSSSRSAWEPFPGWRLRLGVGLTSAVLVLDQALLGLTAGRPPAGTQRGLRLVKLALLTGLSLWLAAGQGLAMHTSPGERGPGVLALWAWAIKPHPGPRRPGPSPAHPGSTCPHRPAINYPRTASLSLQVPHLALPVIVTVLLSATVACTWPG